MNKQTFWCHTRCEGESLFQSSYTSGGFFIMRNYSDSEKQLQQEGTGFISKSGGKLPQYKGRKFCN